ncbi:beta family protein [Emcibacter nanhaiensis]|uniref:Protein beta n=1 Tax=Emcibacter nanhaiensis TaxID=1505037 RepID=A0A501PAX4_9PROT|nr:beta family protein [Emcibacter nanhaiensis]TPD57385.1 protein beta [Emcibacter nanhaiensis]
MIRAFKQVGYCPTLALRPSEMRALEELPEHVKDDLLPLILLQPWTSSQTLDKATDRIAQAYENRPVLIDINDRYPLTGDREVFAEIRALQNSVNGYEHWCNYIENNQYMIPILQIRDLAQLRVQVTRLSSLDRGLALRFTEENMVGATDILNMVAELTAVDTLLVIFDFEQASRELLARASVAISYVNACAEIAPSAHFVVSASSFPDSFTAITEQDIYEREFFSLVSGELGDLNLIYGDRGSARAIPLRGGGGTPAPRVDYPLERTWKFFRKEYEATGDYDYDKAMRNIAYKKAAQALTATAFWDPEVRIWGTQMIEKTTEQKPGCIDSPAKATAVRINLHLHRQNSYGRERGVLLDTDDDFID